MKHPSMMTPRNIADLRLHNQRIASRRFDRPEDVVAWLGAVQAQDYPGALWAVGSRMEQADEETIERALAERKIVRSWPMRGTLHFVAAADIRWMLDLMAPRILARSAGHLERNYSLDATVFGRGRDVVARELQGGEMRSREAIYKALEAAGIRTSGQRGLQILWRLAQEGLVCFGPREGKQQTFVLLEEWLPGARRMERDEALAELAWRYFESHGPATLHDLIWWSGLTAADVRAGIAMAAPRLASEVTEGGRYWFSPSLHSPPAAEERSPSVYLLPNYDEYIVGYKDRSAILDPLHNSRLKLGNALFNHTIVLDGRIAGTWRRELKSRSVIIDAAPLDPLSAAQSDALDLAAGRYGAFLKLPVTMGAVGRSGGA